MKNWLNKREATSPKFNLSVCIYYTPKFYCIIACENYWLTTHAPDLYEKFIPHDADHLTIGITINEAFKKSKYLTQEEYQLKTKDSHDSYNEPSPSYKAFEKRLLEKRGVKNISTLYSTMKFISLSKNSQETTVYPTRRQGKSFVGIDESCNITLANDCCDEKLGEAVYSSLHRWGK